ncbi:hypothetical protein ACFE04_006102 [Oxalis oulophora]
MEVWCGEVRLKSVNSKLEATVARQIQAQFQTSGKHAIQVKLCLAGKDIIKEEDFDELTFDSSKDFDVSSISGSDNEDEKVSRPQTFFFLFRYVVRGNSGKKQSAEDGGGKIAHSAGSPLRRYNELALKKYEEAFTVALERRDLSVVSWLCSQVDLHSILSMVPVPLSQGVLLSLLQQLACDINKDTFKKLTWMTDVAATINPADQMIAVHVRPIFEQVSQILHHQHNSSSMAGPELSSARLLMHVINYML